MRSRDTEDMCRVLFNSSFFGVYVHNFEGNFLDANDAALDMLGYTREELGSLKIASLLSEDEVRRARVTLDEIKRTGRQKVLTRYKLRRKEGGFVWVDTEGFLFYRLGEPYAMRLLGSRQDPAGGHELAQQRDQVLP